ncbi:MAG: hypothetical protein EOP51_02410 [Sphingobacteriales bacterium]|nr:MAG: hypothetical protein EOP51_02410 [Sphingobacteriales bacterium]
MKLSSKLSGLFAAFMTLPSFAHAVSGPGGGGGGVPLNGGLGLLIAAGVGYGIKVMVAARRK